MEQELWKPADFGTNYQVSTYGRVYNLKTGKFLTGTVNEDGYVRHCLSDANGKHWNVAVHVLVMRTFVGPCPDGQQVRHLGGNPANNHWEPGTEEETKAAGGNLIYGTPKENIRDRDEVHGRNGHANKTNCGTCDLPYDDENTYINPAGARVCRNCVRASGRRHEQANREQRLARKRVVRDPDLLSTVAAAALLGCSRGHIRNLCDRGELSFEQVGSHRRVWRQDVLKLSPPRRPQG
jgi:excisionase family DNA binding protein